MLSDLTSLDNLIYFTISRKSTATMAKNLSKLKGKRPQRSHRGPDGRFLLSLPDPPGSPSHLALGLPPQPSQEVAGTPVHPGGLEYPDSSSSARIYAENLCLEADLEPVVACAGGSPSRAAIQLLSAPVRSTSVGTPVRNLPHAPVTMESVMDKDNAARHYSPAMSVSSETGSDDQVEQPHGYSNRVSASVHTCNSHQSRALVRRGLTPEARSTGSADVKNLEYFMKPHILNR